MKEREEKYQFKTIELHLELVSVGKETNFSKR